MSHEELISIAKSGIRLQNIWKAMNRRCNNPLHPDYLRYGGRGISVEWNDFDHFLNDMLPTYKTGLTVDRIDNNGNYSMVNCRWATMKEQCNNRSVTRYIVYKSERLSVSDWATRTGINIDTLRQRLDSYKWPIEKALTTQTGNQGPKRKII